MKIKIDKKQVIKEEKHRPIQRKNIFGDEDSLEDASPNQMLSEEEHLRYVQRVLSEELQDVIAEEVNPRELLKKVCAKKGMIIKAIQNKQVGDLIWWAEALGYVPEEMEELRVNLEKLLGTTPDKILDNPIAMAAAIGAIEMACLMGESTRAHGRFKGAIDEDLEDLFLGPTRGLMRGLGRVASRAGHGVSDITRTLSKISPVLRNPAVATGQLLAPGPQPDAKGLGAAAAGVADRKKRIRAVRKFRSVLKEISKALGEIAEADMSVAERKQVLGPIVETLREFQRDLRELKPVTRDRGEIGAIDDLKTKVKRLLARAAGMIKAPEKTKTAGTGEYGQPGWSLGSVHDEGRPRYRRFYADLKKYGVDPKILGRKDFVWGPKHDAAYEELIKKMNS